MVRYGSNVSCSLESGLLCARTDNTCRKRRTDNTSNTPTGREISVPASGAPTRNSGTLDGVILRYTPQTTNIPVGILQSSQFNVALPTSEVARSFSPNFSSKHFPSRGARTQELCAAGLRERERALLDKHFIGFLILTNSTIN